MGNTNQAVAELGEEAHMVAVPETSTFIYDCFILNVCHFQNTRPVMCCHEGGGGVFGFKQRALFGLYIERSISSFEDPF